jgi:hypothetical protein
VFLIQTLTAGIFKRRVLLRALSKRDKLLNIHQVKMLTEIPFVSVEKKTNLWPKRCARQCRLL